MELFNVHSYFALTYWITCPLPFRYTYTHSLFDTQTFCTSFPFNSLFFSPNIDVENLSHSDHEKAKDSSCGWDYVTPNRKKKHLLLSDRFKDVYALLWLFERTKARHFYIIITYQMFHTF